MDCTDNYCHTSPNILYFPKSIPTKEVEDTLKPTNIFCVCEGICSIESNCHCISKSGSYYVYENVELLSSYVLREKSEVNRPVFECNEQCKCINSFCGNKLVQCGPRDGLVVRICDEAVKGEGLYSEKPIKSANFICEYAGEIISEKEASSRFKANAKAKKMNYIFCIDEYFGETNVKTFIDPAYYGNIGRYVNHSCQPNCDMVVVRIDYNIPILALFACRYIKEGEEISYDYGISDVGDLNIEDKERTKCLCKSVNCRKFLPYDTRII